MIVPVEQRISLRSSGDVPLLPYVAIRCNAHADNKPSRAVWANLHSRGGNHSLFVLLLDSHSGIIGPTVRAIAL
jgi:hypothetical protein